MGASPSGAAAGLIPDFGGSGRLLLVAGIIGATVMPHVVYLHSALTKSRVTCADDAERRQLLRFQRADVLIALGAGRGTADTSDSGFSGARSVRRLHEI